MISGWNYCILGSSGSSSHIKDWNLRSACDSKVAKEKGQKEKQSRGKRRRSRRRERRSWYSRSSSVPQCVFKKRISWRVTNEYCSKWCSVSSRNKIENRSWFFFSKHCQRYACWPFKINYSGRLNLQNFRIFRTWSVSYKSCGRLGHLIWNVNCSFVRHLSRLFD